MLIDIIVAILAVSALVMIIVIVVRKFPKLAVIDTKSIPAEQHDELKSKLIEQRFRRKLSNVTRTTGKALRPVASSAGRFLRSQYQKLLELEKRYRARTLQEEVLTPEAKAEKVQKIEQLLDDARSSMTAGDLSAAEQRTIAAISIDPRSVSAYRQLALIYIEQKDYEHARETLQFVIQRLKVEDDELYAELGLVASGEGKYDEARRDFEKSIVINGHVAQHYLDLSRVQLALGDSIGAFESSRRTVELEPNNPKFLDALVEASIVAGKREWALETLEKLRSVNPENQKLAEFTSRIDTMLTNVHRRA
ncbi:MAG: tetratricopeptide repeat protein [Candidatus Kerfeldbacteria bacterium]